MTALAAQPLPGTLTPIGPNDFALIRDIMAPIVQAQEFFALPGDADEEAMKDYWFGPKRNGQSFLYEENGQVLGAYYLRANQPGLGNHVANAGYMVAEKARGRGLAHRLCEASIAEARRQGFRAMQFNFVVSTNAPAIHTWESCGFFIAGTLPNAYHFRRERYVDAFIMYKEL